MIHSMDLYQVFYFTAKSGSLSKAAEELYITQPAVTHAIKQLEAKLGGPLFFRTSRGVTLTTEGETLYTYIEQAYHFIQNGERKIGEMHQLTDGEVRIGAGDTLCKHVLLPHLKTYHASFPKIKVQVFNRTTADTIALLKEGKIDIGIVNLPISDSHVDVSAIGSLQDCFVAGERYKHLTEEQLSFEHLLALPIMLLEKGSSSRAYIDRFTKEHGHVIKPEIELGSVDLLLEFTRGGFGITCVAREFIAAELAAAQLFEIQLEQPIPARNVGMIKLRSTPLSAAAMHLYRMMQQEV
ncbi:LysR family transcriptional regulator [Paenibacillus roseipurpureus]|uniref:LysR family transcriptional regulator n=1 Tax=Paenibacillus roseopurpureus TaxID=2918901 RepID=A0AA96RI15_9BACL|nr:LysR family transcriptional regulator [Paenibacillus sp. MBLB1832]WNR43848.1 LysR family transcriptional regulator [Paenibacillus sp. MBLB1832]